MKRFGGFCGGGGGFFSYCFFIVPVFTILSCLVTHTSFFFFFNTIQVLWSSDLFFSFFFFVKELSSFLPVQFSLSSQVLYITNVAHIFIFLYFFFHLLSFSHSPFLSPPFAFSIPYIHFKLRLLLTLTSPIPHLVYSPSFFFLHTPLLLYLFFSISFFASSSPRQSLSPLSFVFSFFSPSPLHFLPILNFIPISGLSFLTISTNVSSCFVLYRHIQKSL